MKHLPLCILLTLCCALPAFAAVERLEVRSTEPVASGRSFGLVGPYEKLVGRLHFALDPATSAVVDLDRAPISEDGKVRFAADFYILRPKRATHGNGSLLLEVPNRGGKAVVRYFNRGAARSFDPISEAAVGDGFLFEQGFSLAWVGWQFDVPNDPMHLRVDAVPATAGAPLTGLVRADHVFEADSDYLELGHVGHRAYAPTAVDDPRHQLTVRQQRLGPRQIVPREHWQFRLPDAGQGLAVRLSSGFKKGQIYELVYASADPVVVGVGLAALRDAAAWLRDSEQSPVSVERTIGIGISQTGRLLRHFLYQGFNQIESGGKAFDGLIVHTAGAGRGSFNHRFAQPSRDAHRFRAFVYPTDIYPFTGQAQHDPATNRNEGLLDRLREADAIPRIFYTNTGYEYWGRNAALIHTSLDGQRDIDLDPHVRSYHFASGQHFVGPFPPQRRNTQHAENPLDFLWSLRALLLAMQDWVAQDIEPPASRVPRLADGTLVPLDKYRFPELAPVRIPTIAHGTYRLDFGPRFRTEGVVDQQPPKVGKAFPILVPQVDADGNELGGIRLPALAAPLASYTPWNYRSVSIGAAHELANFRGAFLPLAYTQAERRRNGDSRLSVQERYASEDEYLGRFSRAATALVAQRLLLAEDLPGLLLDARKLWASVQDSSIPSALNQGPEQALMQVRDWLVGQLNSVEQAQEDPNYYAISLRTIEIWPQRTDGPWLYVEQASLDSFDQPYRQRIYQLQHDQETVVSRVYLLPGDALTFAGADAESFARLSPQSLSEREGCAVILKADSQGLYRGSTQQRSCTSTLRGASYASSEVSISETGIDSWDRGYDDSGKQVWGATEGPYQFRRHQ